MSGTRVGCARCSTDEQDVDIQIEQLTALGVAPERIYIDCGFSGTRRVHRAGLDQALAALWPGSILTVTKFDWFAATSPMPTSSSPTCPNVVCCSA
jgi:DNA invertase Pin-like site-specific DNA recombinase